MGEILTYPFLVLPSLSYAGLTAALVYASVVDVRTRFVPLSSFLAGLATWCFAAFGGLVLDVCPFAFAFGEHGATWLFGCIAGGVATAAFAFACSLAAGLIAREQALGGGDVKLLFVVGLYLGPAGGVAALGAASLLALLWRAMVLVGRFFLRLWGSRPLIARLAVSRSRRSKYGVVAQCIHQSREKSAYPLLAQARAPFPFVPFISLATSLVLVAEIFRIGG